MREPLTPEADSRKQRPLWIMPLVTALVFLAVILVLYPTTPS